MRAPRVAILVADDDRLLGGILTFADDEMTIEFTDSKGTSYRVTYAAVGRSQ